jgi:hypothetical protein
VVWAKAVPAVRQSAVAPITSSELVLIELSLGLSTGMSDSKQVKF